MSSDDSGGTILFRSNTEGALPVGYLLQGEYNIRDILGRGGFGISYRAHDRSVDIEVAIKEYFPADLCIRDPDLHIEPKPGHAQLFDWGRERFLKESQLLALLKHENVVRLYRSFSANGTVYSALELVKGETLGMWIDALQRRPTQSEMDQIFEPLIDALAYIHGNQLLHRDLSPNTIVLRWRDERAEKRLTPVMLDFGAAKEFFRKDEMMRAHATAGYSPQEQYSTDGRAQGPWTDIYSMAAVMYFALSRASPMPSFERPLNDAGHRSLKTIVKSYAYRGGFVDAIDWGMQLRPKDRPQSVAEWLPMLFPGHSSGTRRLKNRNASATKIFISYRRNDTKHVAGRIFDRLAQEFGDKEVFFDVDTIPVGIDFRAHVVSSIEQSAVIIAVVGDKWVNRAWHKKRRWMSLFRQEKTDFVEVEIEVAMRSGVPTIPVLIDTATMPGESVLPSSIKAFSYLNATPVRSGRDFRADMERVVQVVREIRGGVGNAS